MKNTGKCVKMKKCEFLNKSEKNFSFYRDVWMENAVVIFFLRLSSELVFYLNISKRSSEYCLFLHYHFFSFFVKLIQFVNS
jgi:hypothetical protein